MAEQSINPLRQRMIQDMTVRGRGAHQARHDDALYLGRQQHAEVGQESAGAFDSGKAATRLTCGAAMPRRSLEVADIFRAHGAAWRNANAGHVSLGQLKVMSAIENCRTSALGGHVSACQDCDHTHIAYNSCRNRHCPKCQGQVARDWLAARQAELLPVPYYHVVFTLPATIADIAYQNKAVIYNLLFKASAETVLTIAADPKHLGARIGLTSVLHTWGSATTHHPHIHMIVPGGGISIDGNRWLSCKPGFFLPVRVLSRLFRRLFLDKLAQAHQAGHLRFFAKHAGLGCRPQHLFAQHLCKPKGSANANRADRLQSSQIPYNLSHSRPRPHDQSVSATPDSHTAIGKSP